MRLDFVYKRLTDGTNHQHFLLAGAALSLKATMQNGQTVNVPVQRVANGFSANLTPQLIPKQLMRLEAIYRVDRAFDGQTFKLLEINQSFIPAPVQTNSVATATYALTPAGWRDALQRQRISNLATNPLLICRRLRQAGLYSTQQCSISARHGRTFIARTGAISAMPCVLRDQV